MQLVGVVGHEGSAVESVVDRLVETLDERGQVATVRRDPTDAGTAHDEDAAETHRLDADGGVTVTRPDADLDAVLDDLAPRVDYAVLVGFADAEVPTVALGGTDHGGETLAAAPDGSEVRAEDVADGVDEGEPYETLASLVAAVKRAEGEEYSGAIATFTGRVRKLEDADDAPTELLEFERYEDVATAKMDAIRDDIAGRDGVHAVRLYHETGVVPAGEDVVHVVVLAGHRGEAFEAVQDGIDRLKAEVPLFKKEVTVEETFWAHERE